ncbi:hypothetical protein CoNPh8_CDS0114 [Staphylococcus phage S-CoN_Ph8]|nr:hypothetical protein CoNPh8_CDS0114 [Staphylococcus phage S-CoN_Ph8]
MEWNPTCVFLCRTYFYPARISIAVCMEQSKVFLLL